MKAWWNASLTSFSTCFVSISKLIMCRLLDDVLTLLNLEATSHTPRRDFTNCYIHSILEAARNSCFPNFPIWLFWFIYLRIVPCYALSCLRAVWISYICRVGISELCVIFCIVQFTRNSKNNNHSVSLTALYSK